jgi:phospholipase C
VTVPIDAVPHSEGIAGPLGLGFRVPALVISPFSRGGLVASEAFDHTSQLRLVERRFGAPVPNLSDWRRRTVGDLTSAFDFADPARDERPRLPSPDLGALRALIGGNVDILLGFAESADPYRVPPNAMPRQESTPVRGRPRGL